MDFRSQPILLRKR
jgi:FAD-dependent urate hydroxylase